MKFEDAMAEYDRHDRHSESIAAIVRGDNRITISDDMISEAIYEMNGATREQAWRVLACALRAGGYEVREA